MNSTLSQIYCNSFFRYVWTGGLGFALDFGTMAALYYGLGLHYQVATALGFLLGLVVVYLICNIWVFANRQMKNSPTKEFAIFAIIGLLGLGLTHLLMWLFVGQCSLEAALAKCFTAVIVLVWNYGARKVIIY